MTDPTPFWPRLGNHEPLHALRRRYGQFRVAQSLDQALTSHFGMTSTSLDAMSFGIFTSSSSDPTPKKDSNRQKVGRNPWANALRICVTHRPNAKPGGIVYLAESLSEARATERIADLERIEGWVWAPGPSGGRPKGSKTRSQNQTTRKLAVEVPQLPENRLFVVKRVFLRTKTRLGIEFPILGVGRTRNFGRVGTPAWLF